MQSMFLKGAVSQKMFPWRIYQELICENQTRLIDFSIGKPIEWAGLLYILI